MKKKTHASSAANRAPRGVFEKAKSLSAPLQREAVSRKEVVFSSALNSPHSVLCARYSPRRRGEGGGGGVRVRGGRGELGKERGVLGVGGGVGRGSENTSREYR